MMRLISVGVVVLLAGCVSAPKEGESLSFYEGGFLKPDSVIAQKIDKEGRIGNGQAASNTAAQIAQSTNIAGNLGGNIVASIVVGELVSLIPTRLKKSYQDDDYIVKVIKGDPKGISKAFVYEVKYNEKMKGLKINDQVALVKDENGKMTLIPVGK
jgi:hypothetical protein